MVKVKFKRLKNDAQLPKQANKGDACFDCYLPETYPSLSVGENRIVPLGWAVEIPEGYEMQIRARSGLASKGLMVSNGIGTIDSGFRSEVGVILFNVGPYIHGLEKGARICQMAIREVPDVELEWTDEISDTERGEGGYGSTGA
jgi:dUTP pyrophosphatase